jgi:hypothetical protein
MLFRQLYSHLLLDLPSERFPRRFPNKILYAFIVSPKIATCLAQRSPLDFIILTILYQVSCRGLNYGLISSLLNFLNCSLVSSFLRSEYFSEHMYSETFSLCSSHKETTFHTHTKYLAKLLFCKS